MDIKDIAQEPEATKKNLYGDTIDKSKIPSHIEILDLNNTKMIVEWVKKSAKSVD